MGPSLGEIVAACVLFFFVLAALATLLILCEECDASEQKRSADLRKRKDVAANWALLVAGSKSWENYRHQADVAHAYHLLRKNGIPAEKIVTMMFDDIANDPQNLNPGTLFNDRTGRNFYEGLVVDYRGNDVNSETFLRVLAGEGKGKVIRSGPNDNIFLFYADHGGIGILSMPVGRLFTRSDLIFNLKAKKEAGGYRRLVVYLESCEGGSMFQDFPKNLDVYAMTASNSFESSYAVLCSEYLPCLADEFSLNWMTDSEMKGIFNRQIQEQFKNAKQHTVASHVSEYGNFEIRNDQIAEFQGSLKEKQNVVSRLRPLKNGCPNDVTNYKRLRIQDIALEMQRRNRSRVIEIEQKRERLIDLVRGIVGSVVEKTKPPRIVDFFLRRERSRPHHLCTAMALQRFDEKCARFSENPFAFQYSFVIANLCEWTRRSSPLLRSIDAVCAGEGLVGVV